MPAEPAPRQPSPALQGLYTQTPDVSAFAVDAKAHPPNKAGTWVMGSNQMVLACAFNAMRAEVTKFEATLVGRGRRVRHESRRRQCCPGKRSRWW